MDELKDVMKHPDNAENEIPSVDLTADGNSQTVEPVMSETRPRGEYRPLGADIPADLKEEDIGIAPTAVSAASVARATGKQIDPAALAIEEPMQQPTHQPQAEQKAGFKAPTPVSTPSNNPLDSAPESSGPKFMSPKQAAAQGIDLENAQKINVQEEMAQIQAEKDAAARKSSDDALAAMLQGSLDSEKARVARRDAIDADPALKAKVFGTPGSMSTIKETDDDRKRAAYKSDNPDIDPLELLPSYDEDEPITPTVKNANDDDVDITEEEELEFIANLPVRNDEPAEKGLAFRRTKEAKVEIVPERPNRTTSGLNNQAFTNAVTAFKKNNFSKVTVPLVNSGFKADLVGTGVMDLQALYNVVHKNTDRYEYEQSTMTTVIRNVVDTHPKIPPMQLSRHIHFADYHMLTYGHVCATLKSVETITNCPECGGAFHITSDPCNLLLNNDELLERCTAIEGAERIEDNSLMTFSKKLTTENGIVITLAHPSYSEYLRCLKGYLDFGEGLSSYDQDRFAEMFDILIMTRQVWLPTAVATSNIMQVFTALGLISDRDMVTLYDEVQKMNKDIIRPRFGIRKVVCPHCKREIKDLPFGSMEDLLFLHIRNSAVLHRAAERMETKKKDAASNGPET